MARVSNSADVHRSACPICDRGARLGGEGHRIVALLVEGPHQGKLALRVSEVVCGAVNARALPRRQLERDREFRLQSGRPPHQLPPNRQSALRVRHPRVVSVNRDERIPAIVPATLPAKPVFPALCSTHTWFSNDGHAVAHQSPVRIKALRTLPCAAPWPRWQPQKALCSPPCPILAAAGAGRTDLWFHQCGDPSLCGSRCGRNELIDLGGIGAGVQSDAMVLPTCQRHCQRRLIDRLCSYPFHPKAFAASNGIPSLMTR